MNTRYHTRPQVTAWGARGGRWTENLGTYVWAFLRPACRAAFLLKACDGEDHLCTPQLALFHGTAIAANGLSFATQDKDLGISASWESGAIRGRFFAPRTTVVEVGLPPGSEQSVAYIDGARAEATRSQGKLLVSLPVGEHSWEITSELPTPMCSRVERTEYTKGGAVVYGESIASASDYILELSTDNGQTWMRKLSSPQPVFTLSGLGVCRKYHVRLLARNATSTSKAGPEYPLYITGDSPAPPSGLHVEVAAGSADVSWGEVLGITEYRLYRKASSDTTFRLVFHGRSTVWKDIDVSIQPPADVPSPSIGSDLAMFTQYCVTAVNQLGESRPSRKRSTDPASWATWNPTPGETLSAHSGKDRRRLTERWWRALLPGMKQSCM